MPSERRPTVVGVPEHLHTVTPRLVVRDGARAIEFYRDAFAAEEIGERFTGPSGELIHAEVRIGDSVVMLTDESEDGPQQGHRSRSTEWSARSWRPTGPTSMQPGSAP